MERLTNELCREDAMEMLENPLYKSQSETWLRLCDIEDVLGNEYDLDRLRELIEADKAGRLYKFRFGVGSTVYRVWVRPDGTHPFISEDKIECLRDMMRAELWAEPYSTREEAEAALEKMKEGTKA